MGAVEGLEFDYTLHRVRASQDSTHRLGLCAPYRTLLLPAEKPRLQEDPASLNLSHFVHDTAQLRSLDRYHAHLLLRVRGTAVGHRAARHALHRVWRQVPREMPGSAERGLPAE